MRDPFKMTILVVLTRGVSLAKWRRSGILGRELAIYRRLASLGVRIALLTYGDFSELSISNEFSEIEILVNRLRLPSAGFSILAPFLYADSFSKADLLKTNQVNGWWTAWIGKLAFSLPMILRCGYLLSENYRRKHGRSFMSSLVTNVERMGFLVADATMVPTEEIKHHVIARYKVPPSKVYLVPNYVDTSLFHPRKSEHQAGSSFRVCFVGSLKEAKNPLALVSAVSQLKISDVELIVIGDGPLRSQMETFARLSRVRARFMGTVANECLPGILQTCDVFAMPSLWEGHPKALLEAMSCGLPVVAYDSPGIRDVIIHGITGWLVEPDPCSLAKAINRVLIDRKLRIKLGKAAREFVISNYGLDSIVGFELSTYRELYQKFTKRKCSQYQRL